MSTPPTVTNPVVLVSIDGWGHTKAEKGNAAFHSHPPHMTSLTSSPLHCLIDASGLSVGLPKGVMGNSEVGHLTMGVGRVEFQDLVRINAALEDGSFYTNPRLTQALDKAKQGSGRFHLLGLVSDGGVHAHIDHLEAFLRAAKKAQVPHTFVHFFADGRDTPPTSGVKYIKRLQDFLQAEQYGKVTSPSQPHSHLPLSQHATPLLSHHPLTVFPPICLTPACSWPPVIGRYYAMDRDKRWERIGVAYEGLFAGKGDTVEAGQLIPFIEKERYAAKKPERRVPHPRHRGRRRSDPRRRRAAVHRLPQRPHA